VCPFSSAFQALPLPSPSLSSLPVLIRSRSAPLSQNSTGLLPSSHGIVANDFWDPVQQKEFAYHEPAKSWGSEWWGGEPVRLPPFFLPLSLPPSSCTTRYADDETEQIWSTAVKNALRSAVLMWPGPPKMADGTKPTYWYPFVDHYHFRKKVERVGKWLGTPFFPPIPSFSALSYAAAPFRRPRLQPPPSPHDNLHARRRPSGTQIWSAQ
jgi:hypothetical protein